MNKGKHMQRGCLLKCVKGLSRRAEHVRQAEALSSWAHLAVKDLNDLGHILSHHLHTGGGALSVCKANKHPVWKVHRKGGARGERRPARCTTSEGGSVSNASIRG